MIARLNARRVVAWRSNQDDTTDTTIMTRRAMPTIRMMRPHISPGIIRQVISRQSGQYWIGCQIRGPQRRAYGFPMDDTGVLSDFTATAPESFDGELRPCLVR